MDRQIDIQELFQKKVEREEMRLAVYDTILERVHKRIQLVAAQDGGTTFSTYVLPEVMIGQPLFKADQCRSFVITSLVKNGFRVRYTHPNLLFISWEHMRPDFEKAEKVISEEQKVLTDKAHAEAAEQALMVQHEHSQRIARREQNTHVGREKARTRDLVKATEDYIPSAQLRNIYFNKRQ
jgi:hypothetical protein